MYYTAPDGVRMYYDDLGSGEPVVLIHGAAGSGRSYDTLIPHLTEHFRALPVDLRGLSRSDRVQSVSATAWCDDILGLMDHLKLAKVHLIGCSLGARIAGRIALDNPSRVISLSVDAPLLGVASDASSDLNDRFTNLNHATADDRERWQRFHGSDWKDVVSFYGRVRCKSDLQHYLTLRPHLMLLTLPTLITRGDIDDRIHPLAHAIEWHSAHPRSWLWIAPGVRFSLTQLRSVQYAAVFDAFIRSCVDRASS